MIDLYDLHHDFPGRGPAEPLEPYARIDALEVAWSADIGDARFIPFLQLHEYEAYLFADAGHLALFYPDSQKQIARLQNVATDIGNPELINDGQHTAPSKRIITEFPDYVGAKSVVGPQVAARIGLVAIRAKCSHFDQWLSRLENLGAFRGS